MKRLLCIVSSLNTGGAETFLMKVFRTLDKEKYKMDFVVCKDGRYDAEVLSLGGRVYTIPLRTKHPFKSYRALKKIAREGGYEYVLKLSDTPIGLTDVMAVKAGGATHVAVRSCNASTGASRLREMLNSALRPRFNKLTDVKIAPSALAARYTFGDKAVDRGEVNLLNNGVDLSVFRFDAGERERIRRELGIDEGVSVVGHVGRFNKQKNHEFLLEVFAEYKKLEPSAILLLVGDGELRLSIEQRARDLGISDSIRLLGVRSDVPALLSAFDVMLFPSFFEGMPNTVIEGQATGLPCVLSDSITPDADITGLLTYLPLSLSAEEWAQALMEASKLQRRDTSPDFISHGYDIQSVCANFLRLCFAEGENE